MVAFKLKDSGFRTTYKSGAQREKPPGKGRFDLLSAFALTRLAHVYEKGARKYDDRNWEKGLPISDCMDSALRHICQFMAGLKDEDHLAQACWNLMAALHMEELIKRGVVPKELNDMPSYQSKPKG